MESTDVVMIESELYDAVAAIEFSHATLRKCIRTYGGLLIGSHACCRSLNSSPLNFQWGHVVLAQLGTERGGSFAWPYCEEEVIAAFNHRFAGHAAALRYAQWPQLARS